MNKIRAAVVYAVSLSYNLYGRCSHHTHLLATSPRWSLLV